MSWLGSIFGDSGGNSGGSISGGDILGGLAAAASIYGQYKAGQNQNKANAQANALQEAKLAEDKRQFDLRYALEQANAGASAAAASAGVDAQLKIAKSNALNNAYQKIVEAVLTGRQDEAASLANIAKTIQNNTSLVIR